jgi:hypothetical protein
MIKCRRWSTLYKKLRVRGHVGYEAKLTNFVTQRHSMVWMAWNTISQRPVSAPYARASFITYECMQSARLLSFFGKSNLKLVTVINSSTFSSALEVPILPWPEACLASQRSGNVHHTKAWKIRSYLISVAIPFLHTRSSSHGDGKAMDGRSYYRESLEKLHKQDNN